MSTGVATPPTNIHGNPQIGTPLPPIGSNPPPVGIAPPVAAGSTEAASADKPKRVQVPRVKYRADDAPKLSSVPADWTSKFLPLAKADFENEQLYYQFKAALAQKQANRFAQLAAEAAAGGTAEERKETKKLLNFRKKYAEMKAKMESKLGADKVAQMLAQVVEQGQQLAAAANAAPVAAAPSPVAGS